MEHIDTIISVLVPLVLLPSGYLIGRALSQFDKTIEELWAEINKNRERIYRFSNRLSVIETMKGIRRIEEDDE